jgi:hypothetical protein
VTSTSAANSNSATLGETPGERVNDRLQVRSGRGLIGLGEDRAHGRRDHLLVCLGHVCEKVAHEVDLAPLPAGALQHASDSGFQAAVRIRDNQADAGQAAVA